MNLGQTIKEIRIKRRISQYKLAKMCGISATALSRIEKDKAFPTKDHIKKICDGLGITSTYLLFLALTDEDVPEKSLPVFHALREPLIKALEQ